MKLYKEFITPDDVVAPLPVKLMESENREKLRSHARILAIQEFGNGDFVWSFEGNDNGYTELVIDGKCRFVIRP